MNFFKPVTFIFLFTMISGCHNTGVDSIDVYKLQFDNTYLFSDYDDFIDGVGLPQTVKAHPEVFTVQSKTELDSIIQIFDGLRMIQLQYPGFEMGYMRGGQVIIDNIDFRKTDRKIRYNHVTFGPEFTVKEFKSLYPRSGNFKLANEHSLFGMNTGETTVNTEHYMLLRRSDNDPYAEPTVEFTFRDGNLIYIFFANF